MSQAEFGMLSPDEVSMVNTLRARGETTGPIAGEGSPTWGRLTATERTLIARSRDQGVSEARDTPPESDTDTNTMSATNTTAVLAAVAIAAGVAIMGAGS